MIYCSSNSMELINGVVFVMMCGRNIPLRLVSILLIITSIAPIFALV
jgi:hypothetical protein